MPWLVKQEPTTFSWKQLQRDKRTDWTGVRNFQARNFLREMKKGDRLLFYHSGDAKEIVGLAKVIREAYPDPTATDGDWAAIDIAPDRSLPHPVTLAQIKADPILNEMLLVRQSRLSVLPVTDAQFDRILQLADAR